MTYFSPAFRFILLIVLLITLPALASGQGGMIDVTKFGAVGDGDNKKARQNTAAIKKAWNQAAKEDGSGGTLYFPAGTYAVNRIGAIVDGFAPLKFTNIKGDGQVKSILRLAPGQNSQLLRIPDKFFDATISDIGLFGNAEANPGTDYLMYLACYNCEVRNVYIARSGGSGLYINGGQQIRISQIDVEHNSGWGIVSENATSITFESISSEYNKKGGLLITSEASQTRRSIAPAIIVRNPYFEVEPIGLELRGISGAEVSSVDSHDVPTSIKISTDASSGLASTGNSISVQGSTGDIEIDKGNYGNSIIVGPYTKYFARIKDYDGRNYIGPLGKAFSEISLPDSRDLTSLLPFIEMTRWDTSNTKASWKKSRQTGQSQPKPQTCKDVTSYQELITSGPEWASISHALETPFAKQTEYYIESAVDIYGSCKVELEVYDTLRKEYYNWVKGTWTGPEKLASVIPTTRMPVLTNGTFQTHQFAIKTDNQPRQPKLTFFVEGCFGRKARFYCTDVRK